MLIRKTRVGFLVISYKVYFFLEVLKIRHVLPLQQHFLMAILLGF